jgi:hypothetical protein
MERDENRKGAICSGFDNDGVSLILHWSFGIGGIA